MKTKTATFLISLFFCLSAAATSPRQDGINRRIFDKIVSAVADSIRSITAAAPSTSCPELFNSVSTGQLTGIIAQQFLGTPYGTAEFETEPEELIVRLDLTNCIFFAEMCASLALTLKSDKPDYGTLVDNIRQMRYRNGEVEGFASRIHYTSEWILQNESRGILREYTDLYGEALSQNFSYMSRHPEQYMQLAGSPETVRAISEMESRLNGHEYFWISKERLPAAADFIREGDIVFFVSKVEGLDISHVAIAHMMNGQMHFIHASSAARKVVNDKRSLYEYTRTGLRLARLCD